MELMAPEFAYEYLPRPIEVMIWEEISLYKAEWQKIGVAKTAKGLDSLIGKARTRAAKSWGDSIWQRPFLTTGGPRLGTIACRVVS
jgi:hypothetical protein